MKKQFKKLSLSKRTISNLNLSEMSNKFGGDPQGLTKKCTRQNSKCDGCSHSCRAGQECLK